MMRLAAALLAALVTTGTARAEHGPPAEIAGGTVAPACIAVKAAYLAEPTHIHGLGSKGPAIALTNKCDGDKTVDAVATATGKDAGKTPLAKAPAELITMEGGYAHYSLFTYVAGAPPCAFPFPTNGDGLQKCGNLPLPARATLALGMPWGSFYEVTGGKDVRVTGEVINPRDPAQAIDWYESRANKADPDIAYQLGMLYAASGPRHDADAAMKWLTEAANHGNAPAFTALAQAYQDGTLTKQDDEAACFWWTLAAKSPWDGAYPQRLAAEKKLTPAQLGEVRKKIEAWKVTPTPSNP